MNEIIWMNLNVIELLTVLQLTTIWNSSYGNTIKQQAIERLIKLNKIGFLYSTLEKSAHHFVFSLRAH